jgi:ABC-type spermidine/putrescine transport system permease subunit II
VARLSAPFQLAKVRQRECRRGQARDHTTFTAGAGDQTLPLWIFTNLSRPNQAPVVNVVAVVLILVSVVPIWVAQRISDGAGTVAR